VRRGQLKKRGINGLTAVFDYPLFPNLTFVHGALASESGFTLLELLITLTIMSILLLVSIPMLTNQIIQSRLKAAAETFVQSAQMARSEALTQQQNVYLSLTSGANWCYGVNLASSCSCTPLNNCGLASVLGGLYPNVTLSNTGFTGGSLYFNSSRGLASVASSVTFTEGTQLITVTIGQLGLFSLCSTGVSGYSAC